MNAPKRLAAIGCRAHTGWAALVMVAGGPAHPEIAFRGRVELGDPSGCVRKNAYHAAVNDAAETARVPVPLHLRNAVTPLMKHQGYGKDYRYVHNDPAAKGEMECLPEPLRGKKYFNPDDGEPNERRDE